ncbi:TetR/AcrR family transcriptional regulator [Gordonia zhaorongruii]|uniref:TetR/AcrR family transcriptional regulator n=1 Tax=Gordonia zhaorongruii TaxID=2597659 RepID=UPI001405324A|nr:TetR/AcrR family transcriptional regulator [Gordonia zhaorongruii]
MSRRTDLLDTAIDVVGTDGIRALTHRRVDERAGRALGSTSNLFRTRRALLDGVLDRLLEVDQQVIEGITGTALPESTDALADALTAFMCHAHGPDATRTRARFAVFAEAAGDATLSAAIELRRADLVEVIVQSLASIGSATDPTAAARALSDHLDGTLLHTSTAQPLAADEFRTAIERHIRAWVA